MQINQIAISEVIPYDRNPRNNQEAIAKVAASIEAFGFRQPIVVDSEMVIIAGHTRLEAAKYLGLVDIPVHIAEGLTPAQAAAYRLADNRTAEDAEWDYEMLSDALKDLDGEIDLALIGFDHDELMRLLGKIDSTDFPELSDAEKGDLEQITFTLSGAQCVSVRNALQLAKQQMNGLEFDNENSNGNALYLMAVAYNAQ